MIYNILATPRFKKRLKKLFKKYPSIKNDVLELSKKLVSDPTLGTSLGNDCYKIRLAITSKGKGKSGGARVITYIAIIQETVYLIAIYDKSDKSTISDNEILELLTEIE